ncbi:MAG TPA: phosphatase domain-containing protein [Enhygromyxa sp.]|nr:phosphatase domain-containing protein [Enhygromyxa sp.]
MSSRPGDQADYELIRSPFPMVRKLQRSLPTDYAGPAYIWDIDKTWLDTRFSQLKGMLKIPFEFAIDKQALPGTTALLHALRQGPDERQHRPLYFITASPPFIRKAIERKMLIDGIEFDGITYKDQIEVFRRREFGSLKEHTAFKLGALLLLARAFPIATRVYLFGDDAERDPLLYCMFADICAGRLRGDRLVRTQMQLGALQRYAEDVAALAQDVPARELVHGVHIHLVREPDGGRIREFGSRVIGYPSAGAIAKLLCERELISERGRDRVEGDGPLVFGEAPEDPSGWWTPRAKLAEG